MPRNVKTIIEKLDTSGNPTSRREARLIKAVVKREGSRTVDNAEFTFPINANVDEGDRVKYIRDITDVAFLTAVYNFQGNDRDESGFDLDGDNTHTNYVDPNISPNIGKFKANYAINFDGTGSAGLDKVIVSDNTRFNFNKQFDIYIWCTHHSTEEATGDAAEDGDIAIFFSKIDNNNSNTNSGIEIGAKYVDLIGAWAPYAKIRQGGTDTVLEMDGTNVLFSTTSPKLIRLWRDENDKVFFRASELSEGTPDNGTTISGDLSNTEDLWIGAGRDSADAVTNRWHGLGFQLRVYSGWYLDLDQSHAVHENAPQPMTMKFAGRIWDIDDNTIDKKVKCKSDGKLLLQTVLNKTILGATHTGENANRSNDDPVFDAGQDNLDIFQSIIKRIDSDFVYFQQPSSGQTINGEYVAEGNFDFNAEILMIMGQHEFFTLPRKVIIVENNTGITSPVVFNNGGERGEQILLGAKDDTNTVNDLEIYGRFRPRHDTDGFGTVDASSSDVDKFTSNHPLNLRVIEHAGTYDGSGTLLVEGTDYTVNFDLKKITFLTGYDSGANNVTAEYDYELVDSSDNDSMYVRDTDTTSINRDGRYGRRMFVTQLTEKLNDLVRLVNNILSRNASIKQRYRVIVPSGYSAVRENHKVTVNNTTKSISNDERIVKQIEWRYPDDITIIQVGEIEFDSLDWQKFDAKANISGVSGHIKTKTG